MYLVIPGSAPKGLIADWQQGRLAETVAVTGKLTLDDYVQDPEFLSNHQSTGVNQMMKTSRVLGLAWLLHSLKKAGTWIERPRPISVTPWTVNRACETVSLRLSPKAF